MDRSRDPVEREAGGARDLYDIATWEPRSIVDRLSVAIYRAGLAGLRALLILLAFLILLAQIVLGGIGAVADPVVGTLVLLSVVPALAIAAYVWYVDITPQEPLSLLVVTFMLAVLFATFAAVVNSVAMPLFFVLPAVVGLPLFFFLVVGPVEEAVKLLAVRLHAYRSDTFDAVIDGAVYGAVAGLGFATIENAMYITQGLNGGVGGLEAIGAAGGLAAVRALAGPGHVLYSAIAGFYLGLAKFNPENAGPIVVKGLLIAAVFHALYNTLVGIVPELLTATVEPLTAPVAVLGFVLAYQTIVGYFLYRKIAGYRRAYENVGA